MHSDKKKNNRIEQYINQNHNHDILDLDSLYEDEDSDDFKEHNESLDTNESESEETKDTDIPFDTDVNDISSGISTDIAVSKDTLNSGINNTEVDKTENSSFSSDIKIPSGEKILQESINSVRDIAKESGEKTPNTSKKVNNEKLSDTVKKERAEKPAGASPHKIVKKPIDTAKNDIDATAVKKRKRTQNKPSKEQSSIGTSKVKETQSNRARNPYGALTIILALTTLVSISLCIYIIITNDQKNQEVISEEVITTEETPEIIMYDQEQVDEFVLAAKEEASKEKEDEIKEYIRSVAEVKNPNFAEMLRQLYPENVVYVDTDGYHFVPIDESLSLNAIQAEQLFSDDVGNFTYVEDSVVTSQRGIDVSQHQGNIDWNQVAASGIEFAIIRVGFRGYGSGALVLDEQFENNIKGAADAGLEVGVYFFTQAISAEEAIEEANFVIEAIKPYSINGPVVIDVERPDDSSARGNALTAADRTGYVKLFCDAVEKEGYTSMIYGNTYSLFAMLDLRQLTEYDKWYAFYNDYLYYPYEVEIWQYSASASVPGINSDVDINIRFSDTKP